MDGMYTMQWWSQELDIEGPAKQKIFLFKINTPKNLLHTNFFHSLCMHWEPKSMQTIFP
jgi:hypothetical protein